jgi:hypothetical protein
MGQPCWHSRNPSQVSLGAGGILHSFCGLRSQGNRWMKETKEDMDFALEISVERAGHNSWIAATADVTKLTI